MLPPCWFFIFFKQRQDQTKKACPTEVVQQNRHLQSIFLPIPPSGDRFGHGSKSRTPVNIPIPTTTGSKTGGAPQTPKMGSQNGFDNRHFKGNLVNMAHSIQRVRGINQRHFKGNLAEFCRSAPGTFSRPPARWRSPPAPSRHARAAAVQPGAPGGRSRGLGVGWNPTWCDRQGRDKPLEKASP